MPSPTAERTTPDVNPLLENVIAFFVEEGDGVSVPLMTLSHITPAHHECLERYTDRTLHTVRFRD